MIYIKLLLTFLKIGAFTFGGGYAMLPFIQEAVLNNNWLSATEIVDFIAVSESTPGPFAVNIATYVGKQTAGILGAACATCGVVLPSFIIILIIAKCFEKFKNNKIIKGLLFGLKPAVVGMIGAAILSVGETALFPIGFSLTAITDYSFLCALLILAISLFLIFKKKLHPIFIILLSAVLGITAGYIPLWL